MKSVVGSATNEKKKQKNIKNKIIIISHRNGEKKGAKKQKEIHLHIRFNRTCTHVLCFCNDTIRFSLSVKQLNNTKRPQTTAATATTKKVKTENNNNTRRQQHNRYHKTTHKMNLSGIKQCAFP